MSLSEHENCFRVDLIPAWGASERMVQKTCLKTITADRRHRKSIRIKVCSR